MEEPKYINYGNLQVDLNQFLTSAANDIEPYLNRQPWSNKRKELFRKAYSDIMSLGITGASNTSGFWEINHGGLKIDLDSKSLIEREMYGEAAYYILLKMSGLATDKLNTEEEKKKDLKTLDNQTFISGLENYIGTQRFGGLNWNIGGPEDLWNKLDPRNEKGIRGRKNRADALARYLEEYGATINETTHSFENSPFTDYKDFKTRLDAAVLALKNNPDTSDDALNALGINPSRYFNNGSGDAFSKGDYTGTYGGYQEYLALLRDALAKLRAAEIASRPTIYTNTIKNNGFLYSQRDLADLYGSTEGLLNQVRQYLTKGLNNLTNNEKAEVRSAMVYGAKNPISNEEWEQLKNSPSLKGASRTRFKKINGIDNLFLDSATGNVIHLYDLNFRDSVGNDFLAGLSTEDSQKDFMSLTGFTPFEQREVGALLLDLAAAIDLEGASSAVISQIASGIRDYNRASDPEGWTWGDTGWAALDHATGLISAIPIVGGWFKGVKASKDLIKYMPKVINGLRYLGRFGATTAMIGNANGALTTAEKIFKGEDVTPLDVKNLAQFFIGAMGHHQLNRSNLTARTAMKARGLETTNTVGNKLGFTRTKLDSEVSTPTLKIKVGDNEVDVPINKEIQEKIGKMSPKERSELAKSPEAQKAAEEFLLLKGIKIKDESGNYTKEWNEAKIVYEPSWRDKTIFGKGLPRALRSDGKSFGTITDQKNLTWNTLEEFEANLAKRDWWDKFIGGSNRDIRRYDRTILGNIYPAEYNSSYPSKLTEEEINNGVIRNGLWGQLNKGYVVDNTPIDKSIVNETRLNRGIMKRWRDIQNGKFSNRDMITENNVKVGNENVSVYNTSTASGEHLITIKTSKGVSRFKSLEEAKKHIASIIKELKNNIVGEKITRQNAKELGKILLDFKKKGWLKHGGRIDRLKIQQYKEFMKR